MIRKFMYHYLVRLDEKVTIKVEPFKVGPRVAAAQNGQPLNNIGGNTPTFRFTVTEPVGNSHFAKVDFQFVDGDDNKAEFRPEVSGSNGGNFPTNPVKKTSSSWIRDFRFEVVP